MTAKRQLAEQEEMMKRLESELSEQANPKPKLTQEQKNEREITRVEDQIIAVVPGAENLAKALGGVVREGLKLFKKRSKQE